MKRRERGGIVAKLLGLICLAAFCFLIYLMRDPLLRMGGGYWVVEDSPVKSDALIVLSDDNFTGDRANRAAELFRGGFAARVVASGRRLRPYAGVVELIERDLIDHGVPKEAIVRLPQDADNTLEEAQAILPLALKQKWNRVTVVTSNYHTRRTRYIYKHIFPASIEIKMASAQDVAYDPAHWWYSRKGVKLFFTETVGMVVAAWQLRDTKEARAKLHEKGRMPYAGTLHLGSAEPWDTMAATVLFALQAEPAVISSLLPHFPPRCPRGPQLHGFGVCVLGVTRVAKA